MVQSFIAITSKLFAELCSAKQTIQKTKAYITIEIDTIHRDDLRGKLLDFAGYGQLMSKNVQTRDDVTPLDQLTKWATLTQLHT